jgi:hypothetical protein
MECSLYESTGRNVRTSVPMAGHLEPPARDPVNQPRPRATYRNPLDLSPTSARGTESEVDALCVRPGEDRTAVMEWPQLNDRRTDDHS